MSSAASPRGKGLRPRYRSVNPHCFRNVSHLIKYIAVSIDVSKMAATSDLSASAFEGSFQIIIRNPPWQSGNSLVFGAGRPQPPRSRWNALWQGTIIRLVLTKG